jgi:hypothetical protein
MAKLPDIKYGAVQTLHSPRAAALPGKLRSIDAAVQAVDRGVSAIDKAVETEARLDAGRRFQEAQRDYNKRRSDLVLEYHTTDKPLENFQQELTAIRQDTFSQKMPQGGRTQKYFRPDMDAFETRAAADELNTFRELTESRSKFHLEVSSNNLVNSVQDDPGSALAAIDEFNYSLVGNGLGQEENRAFKAQNTQAIMTEAISQLVDEGKTAEAAALTQHSSFDDVPQKARLALEEVMTKATYSEMDDFVQETANNLLIGQGSMSDLQTALKATEVEVAAFSNLTEEQQDDLTKASQGEMAFRYFQGQLMEGRVTDVKTALESGEYSDILTTAQTKQLMGAINSGQTGANVKGLQFRLSSRIEDTIRAAAEGTLLAPESWAQADADLEMYKQSYFVDGKTEPDTAWYALEKKLKDAKRRNNIQLETNANPQGTQAAIQASYGDRSTEAVNARTEYRTALVNRTTGLVTDPIGMARATGITIPGVLPPGAEGHLESLVTRFGFHGAMVAEGGEETGGPLEPTELDTIVPLLNQMNTEQLLAYASGVVSAVGEENAIKMFDQMYDDNSMNVVPAAARLASFGLSGDATKVLAGEAILKRANTNIKPHDLTDVRTQIQQELKGAYGEDWRMYDRTVDAVVAHYAASTMGDRGDGNFGINPERVSASVKAVTGGLVTAEGRTYVAPTPNTNEYQFGNWMRNFDASVIPPLADMNGTAIPAEDVRDGLYDGNIFTSTRFELVEAGPPGLYYIMDTRSQSLGGTGGLLFDGGRPGQYATIRYREGDVAKPLTPITDYSRF